MLTMSDTAMSALRRQREAEAARAVRRDSVRRRRRRRRASDPGDDGEPSSGYEDDLAQGVTLLEFAVGLPHLDQGIDRGDGDLQASLGDQSGQLGQDLGRGRRPVPVVLGPVFAAASRSMMVLMRSGATPSSTAIST